MRWRAAQIGQRLHYLVAAAFDEAFGLDLALQMFRRDVRAEGINAGVERDHGQE
jgi:hypothetical protein